MVAFTLPAVHDGLGQNTGQNADGQRMGNVPPRLFDIGFKTARIIQNGRMYTEDRQGSTSVIVDITTAANDDLTNDVAAFPASPTVNDAFHVVIPENRSFVKCDIDVAVAGSGLTYAVEYWNSTTRLWTAVSNLSAPNLFQSTGVNFVSFDIPVDHGIRQYPVGSTTDELSGKPIRFRITSVTGSPVVPRFTRVYPINDVTFGQDITAFLSGISAPEVFSYEQPENALYLGMSDRKFWGFRTLHWKAATGTYTIANEYWNGGDWVTIPIFYSTSNEERFQNLRTITPKTFTASAVGGTTSTVEGISDDGCIISLVNTVPTVSTGGMGYGLSASPTGAIDFELRKSFVSGAPRLQVYEGGVLRYTHTSDTLATDRLCVLRYLGTIYYQVNEIIIYTSATTNSTAILLARAVAVNTGAVAKNLKFVNLSNRLGYYIPLTFQSTTNGTITDETPITDEVVSTQYGYLVPPTDWVANTAENSPAGVAGFTLRERIASITGVVRGATVSAFVTYPLTANDITGLALRGTEAFGRVSVATEEAVTTDSTFFIASGVTGSFLDVTIPAGTRVSNQVKTASFPAGEPLYLVQMSGVGGTNATLVLSN